jgi:hypothetical protein
VVHEVELDWPGKGHDKVSTAPGLGLYREAEERRADRLCGEVSLGEDGI